MGDKPLFELDYRPAAPPPPAKLILRRNDGRSPLVMAEDEALELYMVLRSHFERGESIAGQEADHA